MKNTLKIFALVFAVILCFSSCDNDKADVEGSYSSEEYELLEQEPEVKKEKTYIEHYMDMVEENRKICAELKEKNWEDVLCIEWIPEVKYVYESNEISFYDFEDLALRSKEDDTRNYCTFIANISGMSENNPLYVVAVVSYDKKTTEQTIERVYYNTLIGFTYAEPWIHPDGNVFCDAYATELWQHTYNPRI